MPSPIAPRGRNATWGIVLLVAAAGMAVYWGAAAGFFAQDDFAGLARAAGLSARLSGPWRYLSGQTYFDLMRALAGLDPRPYHVVSLLVHAVTAALVFVLARRMTSLPAAALGATFFATHPAPFTALYSVSGIGELLAAAFALGTILATGAAGATRWIAVPLFAAALMCKETTLLLPLYVGADRWLRRAPGSSARPTLADPVLAALGVVAIAYAVSFVTADAFSIRQALPSHAAYAVAFDATLVRNLLTYLGWTANFLLPTVTGFSDAVDPSVFPYGVAVVVVWLAGLLAPGLRARGWLAGGLLAACLLAPVLPLRNHTYHYYLYGPLAGAALCVAAGFEQIAAWRTRRDTPVARGSGRKGKGAARHRDGGGTASVSGAGAAWTAAALAVALAVNGAWLVRKIEHHPFIHPDLRADPTVDRGRIARNVYRDLGAAALPPGVTRLLFWSPAALQIERDAGRDVSRESYWERNVRDALLDGLAVRLLFPTIREVAFVREYRPVDDATRYAVYLVDGHVRVASSDELRSALDAMPPP